MMLNPTASSESIHGETPSGTALEKRIITPVKYAIKKSSHAPAAKAPKGRFGKSASAAPTTMHPALAAARKNAAREFSAEASPDTTAQAPRLQKA